MIEIISGNLLDSKEQYICHQCNCVTDGLAAGLAMAIFNKHPYSDVYKNRKERSVLGTISIHGNGENDRFVVNMFSQYYPGHPVFPNDNVSIREAAFKNCLNYIGRISNLVSIAFPYMIGCGLANGDWDRYYKMLETFANDNPNVVVKVYKLPE